jgi:uncharacterized lipoprotein YajG
MKKTLLFASLVMLAACGEKKAEAPAADSAAAPAMAPATDSSAMAAPAAPADSTVARDTAKKM